MKHVMYGIRSWDNESIQRKCHQCGTVLGDYYIKANDFYFCPMKQAGQGFDAHCFSEWARDRFPKQMAARMIVELPTPEMTG